MTLDDLTVNFSHLDRKAILADWKWLIGKAKLPILLTAGGDAFLQHVNDGSVHLLDVAAGTVSQIASSVAEFQSLLSDREFVYNHLSVAMVADLLQSGRKLSHGQIFSFKIPPVLGGEYVLSNVEVSDIEVHFSLAGQVHEKVSKLAPGTQIKGVSIS
jgi:hypothetical protein